jgi:hypothetical protein
MEIVKYPRHCGTLGELTRHHSAFGKLKSAVGKGTWADWITRGTRESTREKMVLFIGKTGYGKSTTINAIAGVKLLETSDVSACTRVCQCLDYHIQGEYWLSLGDLPGVGESKLQDATYFKLYENFLEHAAAIVYVIRADARDHSIDEITSRRLFKSAKIRRRVIYALGQCDKIEPINREQTTTPTEDQMRNIRKKVKEVNRIFHPENPVIPYSAATGWNLQKLVSEIAETTVHA